MKSACGAMVLVVRGRWADPPLAGSVAATTGVMLILWGALGMTLRTNPGGAMLASSPNGKPTYSWLYWTSTYQGPVRDWAKWNFEGLDDDELQAFGAVSERLVSRMSGRALARLAAQ